MSARPRGGRKAWNDHPLRQPLQRPEASATPWAQAEAALIAAEKARSLEHARKVAVTTGTNTWRRALDVAGDAFDGQGENPGFPANATLAIRSVAASTVKIPIGRVLTLIHLVGIPITNTSVNPARSIGPALLVGDWALEQLWLFIVAPPAGALLAAGLHAALFAGGAPIEPEESACAADTAPPSTTATA